MISSAVVLQTSWRKLQSVREANRRRDERVQMQLEQAAALQLQGALRSRRARRLLVDVILDARRRKAASRIQRAWRRRVWMRAFGERCARRMKARAALKGALAQHEQHVAAEVLQIQQRRQHSAASPRSGYYRDRVEMLESDGVSSGVRAMEHRDGRSCWHRITPRRWLSDCTLCCAIHFVSMLDDWDDARTVAAWRRRQRAQRCERAVAAKETVQSSTEP